MALPAQESDHAQTERPRAFYVRLGVRALKLAVVVLVLIFVSQAAESGFNDLRERGIQIRFFPAVGACLVFACAQLVMAGYWRQVVAALGQPAPWGPSVRAYHVSQIGKYVPGKASVVLIRTERLLRTIQLADCPKKSSKPNTVAVGASVFYETLTFMAVGSLLSAALTFARVGGTEPQLWVILLSLGLAAACVTPTLPPIFDLLLKKVVRSLANGDADPQLPNKLTAGLAGWGVVASLAAWTLMGVSVWLTAVAVEATGGFGLGALPLWTLAATLPPIAGFVSLLPAGAIVREALTLGLLAPAIGEANALAITIGARLVGLVTEVTVCVSLLIYDTAIRTGSAANLPSSDDPL